MHVCVPACARGHVYGRVGDQVNILRFESKSYKGFKVKARRQMPMHHMKKAPLDRKIQKKVRIVSMGLSCPQKGGTEEGIVTRKKITLWPAEIMCSILSIFLSGGRMGYSIFALMKNS